MSHLDVQNLTKNFGGVVAVNDVSISVQSGERYAIIGPNGAGKSTLFNLIAGEIAITSGSVFFTAQKDIVQEGTEQAGTAPEGIVQKNTAREITNLPVNECANLGIGRTFQRNNLFLGMNALENVRLAVQHQQGVADRWFRAINGYDELNETSEILLDQVGLWAEKDRTVSELAYGQQRALEIALALAVKPKILLLDEPTAGMSPAETGDMVKLIQSLPRDLTLMIVEHDMDVIFTIADRVTVLHYGEVIATGTPAEVRGDPKVREIYLGTAA